MEDGECYMLEKDLEELVRKIQSIHSEFNNIEVKAAHDGCPKKLYDTISAFSNLAGGGIIVFGLHEKSDFSIIGVYDAADLQKKVTEQCKQMQPVVRALFTCIELEGRIVVAAEIPEIDIADKPCFYRGRGRLTGSYIRVGDADEPMTEYEIYSYDAFRKKYQDDIRSVDQATFSLLDENRLAEYIMILKKNKSKLVPMSAEQIYELMRITKNRTPTLAGLLLFGIYPQGIFPQLCITAIAVPGTEIGEVGAHDERFIDNKRIDGTLPEMLEEAVRFVQHNMSIKTIIDSHTGKRCDKEEYPLLAVREIILNALIHRDYSIHTEGMPIQLILYKDRMEVRNPGGLYGRIRVSDLGKVQPDTRNPSLAVMMEDLGLTENRYSGIPTIYRVIQEAGLPVPDFSDRRGAFSVTLYNEMRTIETEQDNRRAALLDFCQEPRNRNEIKTFLGLKTTYHVMHQYVIPLIDEKKLKMTIPDKPKSKYQKFVSTH
jgi:ATP-dependent DNA helicase RecG